jgi:serine/threonine protein phosphatase 1
LEKLAEDAATLGLEVPPVVVFLGDYVDRGDDSRAVIERIIQLQSDQHFEVRALKGNHDEAFLQFLQDASFGPTWAEYGGMQTLLSYGVAPPLLRSSTEVWEAVRHALGAALPRSHLTFLTSLELMVIYGDYAFVHAGIRKGVALSAQAASDLLWIRDDFLQAKGPFEKVIVHGHTPEAEPFLGVDRVGIDTGAYATGILSAVRLQDTTRRTIQAKRSRVG